MTIQPEDTNEIEFQELALNDDRGYSLLTHTAQQAVLPRRLAEGVYAILKADGGIKVVETPKYKADREEAWRIAHAYQPDHIEREATVTNVASFLDYLGTHNQLGADGEYSFGEGMLEVWANIDSRTILGVCDGVHGWARNTVRLELKHSREWAEWAQIDGKLLNQVEFAEFIESHISNIGAPDGATLLDICQTLQAHTQVTFKQQNILANGQRQFQWEETTEAKAGDKGNLKIPGELILVVRVFQGSDPVQMTARFRYQLREGVLRIGVKLAEPDRAVEEAFNDVTALVQEGVPVRVNDGRG